MISKWEEFRRFFACVKPLDVRVYGKLSEEAEAWIGQFDVLSKKFEATHSRLRPLTVPP